MKRRDFIRAGSAFTLGALSGLQAFGTPSDRVSYSDACSYPEKRQAYLDGLMNQRGREYPYADCVSYSENPLRLVAEKALEILMESESESVHIQMNPNNLALNYSFVFIPAAEEFGLGKKSEVYVFPFAFENLFENELRLSLFHEDSHCRDIAKGMKISGSNVDVKMLDSSAIKPLLEMRAYHSDMKRIRTAQTMDDQDVIGNVREAYIGDVILRNYGHFYDVLKTSLEEGAVSDYTGDVLKEHLIKMSEWIDPEFRYKK